jgi:hypothetical protein
MALGMLGIVRGAARRSGLTPCVIGTTPEHGLAIGEPGLAIVLAVGVDHDQAARRAGGRRDPVGEAVDHGGTRAGVFGVVHAGLDQRALGDWIDRDDR